MCVVSALLAFTGVAATLAGPATLPHATFYYEISSSMRRVDDSCRVCYGDDCLMLSPTRCEYFMEIDEIMDRPERGGEGSQIDTMISEMTEQATMSWLAQDCIPLISSHTTCNKENLCIGCEVCSCSAAGRWSCSQVQQCRADPEVVVSHRTLVVLMEKLLEHENKVRRKRLIENVTDEHNTKPLNIEDIAEWLYDATPVVTASLKTEDPTAEFTNAWIVTETLRKPHNIQGTTTQSTALNTPTDTEYLGFEEVLRNIANDQIYNRRKSQLYENSEIDLDYMELEDTKPSGNHTSVNFMKMLNDIEEGKNVTESTSDGKFVVDLYPREYKHNYDDYNETGYTYIFPKEDNNTLNLSSESGELDSVNVMKREVSVVTDVNNMTQGTTVTPTTLRTTTQKRTDLENHVLKPLTNIINDKENEVKELLHIRENLVTIMKMYHNKTGINLTKESEKLINSSPHFSIFKLDLYPEISENLRRINPNVMGKLLYKLKRDIYEVFRDITRVQKISKTQGLPDDLRLLIRSMKQYVRKQGDIQNFKKNEILLQKLNETSKVWTENSPTTQTSLIRQLVNILEEIDSSEPLSNVYSSASKSSKKIIKRVIKQNYADDFSLPGYKTSDSEFNLTNELKTIGKSWPQLTAKLANSLPHEKLYALKLLHFSLTGDMHKMTDVIALINFAHSRRMTPIETPMAEELMVKINSGLLSIKQKVQSLIKYKIRQERNQLQELANLRVSKKESFLKRIKNLLRNSKHEIIDMVKKKVPKTEIFKTIAKKKLHDLSQKRLSNEETMLKWQQTLSTSRRKKREVTALVKTMKSRMKNIIPKYLRGKINPAIAKQKSKKQSVTKNKKTNKHKNSTSSTAKPKKHTTSLPKKRKTIKQNTLSTQKHSTDHISSTTKVPKLPQKH